MNQSKKSLILGSALGLTVAASAILFSFMSNARAETANVGNGPNYTPERHAQMEEAFANNNYAQWKELQGNRGRVSQVVNEGNFARFAEAHRLMLAGQTEEANKIRAELGLNGNGKGQGKNGCGCGCSGSCTQNQN